MRIGLNTLSLNTGHRIRGIGFYTENLYQGLKKHLGEKVILIDNQSQIDKCDVIHYPTFDFFNRTLHLSYKKNIVTIHDVIPLMYPKYYPPGIKGKIKFLLQKRELRNVDAVITDSEASKNEIIKYLNIPSNKIFVVYLAVGKHFKKITDKKKLESIKTKYNLPKKFVLFTGSVNWNKNLVNMAQACVDIGIDFVLIGGGFYQKEHLEHVELQPFAKFIHQFEDNPLIHTYDFMPHADLNGILNLAEISLFASFVEGFGLPILEAQTCGVPIITSNVSSMPEVGGEGALYVDPNNVEDIKEKLNQVLKDENLRRDLIKKGFLNVKRFSWEKTAKGTIRVYKYALIP